MDYSLAITVPTVIISALIASRALRAQRPAPTPADKIALLRKIKFQTGDLILFHCNPFITTFSDGNWSHVGMVIVGNSGIPRLFEITGSGRCEATAKPLHPILIENLERVTTSCPCYVVASSSCQDFEKVCVGLRAPARCV